MRFLGDVAVDKSAVGDWQTKNPVKMASLLTELEGILSDEQETKDAVARVKKVKAVADREELPSGVLLTLYKQAQERLGLAAT